MSPGQGIWKQSWGRAVEWPSHIPARLWSFAGAASAVGIAPASNGMETSTGSTSHGWADSAEGSGSASLGSHNLCHHGKHPEAPCSHPGGSAAEAKVPPEALNLQHRT